MKYIHPGLPGSKVSFKKRYGNFINGQFVDPVGGRWFTSTTPVTGENIAEFPRSGEMDIESALTAAHEARADGGQHRSRSGRIYCLPLPIVLKRTQKSWH